MKQFKKPYVRFFNADCYGRDMTFFIGGNPAAENIGFGNFTPYIEVPDGVSDFTVSCLNCGEAESGGINLMFDNSSVYTVAAVSIGDSVSLYGIREIFDTENDSMGHLRVCNFSCDISNADIYAGIYKILGGLDYLEISKYMSIIPDTYDFTVREANSEKVILSCGKQTVKSGKFNTLYLIGRINSNPSARCVFSIDAMSYDGDTL